MTRIWRSMLYVPANVLRFVEKSATSGADAILLDLEDSIPHERKSEARAALATAIPIARAGGADVLVRVNRPLRLAVGDIEAAVAAGADGILLTKVLGPDHVQLAAELLTGAMRIIPMVETAAALRALHEIARASPRVAGLLIGAEDLAAECGAAADDEIIAMAKRQMVLAAVAAGVAPLGTLGTVADYRDAEKIRALVTRSKRAGMVGASCIHPSLVAILNEGFSPSAAELDLARRQIAAGEDAAREGRGSFVVDGMMVDEPILIRARRILAQAG
ncbi:CoA ester lyase [Sediminicoccus sp. KRV36]|uniref:HpcH/HpaI aldolase/citrate lyase family protein n=1 Tax=Sediminicoccus sp. KRV36 TaxID=3133721 RepID=UPI002010B46B|nr:CoA ester lyase [Sediminicoccus rosea]UPY36858.1 CoA ester lyase [Sediminicoccus rosea]